MSEFWEFEHSGWQSIHSAYAQAWGSLTSQAGAALLDATDVGLGSAVLDVACGPGYVAAEAQERGAQVIATDFAAEMVSQAKQLHPTLDVREGDAEHLEFEDQTFDSVVMNFGMLHLGQPDIAAAEAFRVLREGGAFAYTVWCQPSEARGFSFVLDAVAAHGQPVELPAAPNFFRFSDPDSSAALLHHAGFTKVESHVVPMTWTLSSAEAVFDAYDKGSARTGALLRAQTDDARMLLRDAITKSAIAFQQSDGSVRIPMPAMLTVGRVPAE
jgi:ubiquinone/menaquinone biosynthesis C-methylase UbiE